MKVMVTSICAVCQCKHCTDDRTVCKCNCVADVLFASAVNCPFYCNEVSGQDAKVIMDSARESRASCTSTCASSSSLLIASAFRLENFMATGELGAEG